MPGEKMRLVQRFLEGKSNSPEARRLLQAACDAEVEATLADESTAEAVSVPDESRLRDMVRATVCSILIPLKLEVAPGNLLATGSTMNGHAIWNDAGREIPIPITISSLGKDSNELMLSSSIWPTTLKPLNVLAGLFHFDELQPWEWRPTTLKIDADPTPRQTPSQSLSAASLVGNSAEPERTSYGSDPGVGCLVGNYLQDDELTISVQTPGNHHPGRGVSVVVEAGVADSYGVEVTVRQAVHLVRHDGRGTWYGSLPESTFVNQSNGRLIRLTVRPLSEHDLWMLGDTATYFERADKAFLADHSYAPLPVSDCDDGFRFICPNSAQKTAAAPNSLWILQVVANGKEA